MSVNISLTRLRSGILRYRIAAIGFSLVVCFAAEGNSSVPSIAEAARVLAEVTSIHDIQLSPDGRWIVYAIKRRSVDTNEITQSSVLQRLPQEASAPLPQPITLPATASAVRWHPDSQRLSMIVEVGPGESTHGSSFVYYNVGTGEVTPIPVMRGTLKSAGASSVKADIDSVGSDYQWSPRGRFVAFTAPLAKRGGLDPRRGVLGSETAVAVNHGLFVLDAGSGLVKLLTSEAADVTGDFSWSPDESTLAVTMMDEAEGDPYFSRNIFSVERQSGVVRPLMALAGMDRSPVFSPDGRWIAFATQFGNNDRTSAFPAVMPANAGSIISFPPHQTPRVSDGRIFWRPDGQTLIYPALIDNRGQLVRADIGTREIRRPRIPEGELPHDGDFSFSRDGRWMAYTRESVKLPKELFVVALDSNGEPLGVPRQLTQLTARLSFASLVRADVVNWQSADGQATIHGALLTPTAAWRGERVVTPLPTILFSCGANGVSFMNLSTNSNFYGLQVALAARGYAVLCPMVRGNDGYGKTFGPRVRDVTRRRHFWREVFEDAMAGLDDLIRQGVADANRLGMMGHSTDSMLTQYATVKTDRLKAAVMYEGIITDYSWYALKTQPHVDNLSLEHVRELAGAWDIFDPAQRAQILAESPGHNANRVTTPSLLLCGAVRNGFADRECKPWADLLERFCVPSAYFVYDEAHGFERPAAVADFLTRTAEWMDFWLRGIPYPDPGRAREYDRWRNCRKGVYTNTG